MIVSHKHKFIFLKTRKTAGTSIEIALSRFCGEKDVITPINKVDERIRTQLSYRGPQNFRVLSSGSGPQDGRVPSQQDARRASRSPAYYNHMLAKEARAIIGTKTWDEYFKFCFERNPWDKIISAYYWRTRNCEHRPTLLEFIHDQNPEGRTRGKGTRRLSNFGIYSIGGEIAVDHVGLYENLDSELERIAALLNLPGKIELPRAKASVREDRRHYREVMGYEERSMVAQVCAREIAHFSYSF